MWCPHCNSETSATGESSSGRSTCAKCGKSAAGSKSSQNTIRQARDIIAKWSSSDLLDQISSLPPIPPMSRPHISAQAAAEKPSAEPEQSVHETKPDNSADDFPKTPAAPVLNETAEQPTTETEEDGPLQSVSEVIEDITADSDAKVDDDAVAFEVTEDDLIAEVAGQSDSVPEIDHQDTPFELELKAEAEAEQPVELESADPTPHGTRKTTEKVTLDETDTDTDLTLLEPKYIPLPVALAARAARNDEDKARPLATSTPEQCSVDPPRQVVEPKPEASKSDHIQPSDNPKSRPRTNQRRASQPRPTRERKHSADAEHQGSKPVSRKFRVDTPGGEPQQAPEEVKANVAGTRIQSNSPQGGRRHRIDDGAPVGETLRTGDSRVRTQNRPRRRYIDEAHDDAIRGPHFQVTAPKRTNLTSMTGHVLAYLGVLGLTVGTAIVICGHFLGYSDYTPTGWLVTTVAQMMLFLGVINLVSGGIDQTNEDVSNRINNLGEQLLRIEQVTEEALRGPKISASRYLDPNAEVEEHERETVGRPQ